MRIDLNADLGESYGVFTIGQDEALLQVVTSANVACGFHGGDPSTMRRTVRLAREAGVSIGAHPSFPDLVGFGRREMTCAPREVEDMVAYQIGALGGIAAAEGVRVRHVKPHGALYNMAGRDRALANAIVRAVAAVDRALVLYALAGSALVDAGRAAGLTVASEGFADRAYQADGALVPRSRPGAVIHDEGEVVRRTIALVREGIVTAIDGSRVPLRVDTICTHGDTPGAAALVARLREALGAAGVTVAPIEGPTL